MEGGQEVVSVRGKLYIVCTTDSSRIVQGELNLEASSFKFQTSRLAKSAEGKSIRVREELPFLDLIDLH